MPSELITGKTSFVTFYSFKGGVGRSMAMINVAGMLAGRGFRVLALDMDLEAPGISYLLRDRNQPGQESAAGFVDLLAQACAEGDKSDLFALPPAEMVARYTHPYALPEELVKSPDGELRIMPAGRLDPDYQKRLNDLALGKLYESGLGQPLIQAFKRILCDAKAFDFALVDSRTGFSDESGICTRDLADHLVVVMGLNHQNQEGTATFLRSLPKPKEGAPEKGLRVVLSPVPIGEDELIDQREKQIKQTLQSAFGNKIDLSLRIPYHPRLALTEEPHVFRRSRGYLFQAYADIEKAVLAMMGLSVHALEKRVDGAIETKILPYLSEAFSLLIKIDPKTAANLAGSLPVELLASPEADETCIYLSRNLDPGSLAYKQIAIGLHKAKSSRAKMFYEKLLSLDPGNAQYTGNLAALHHEVLHDNASAEKFYERALILDPNNATNLGNYAFFLQEAKQHYEKAEQMYERALAAPSRDVNHMANYAVFLVKFQFNPDKAESIYQKIIEVNPKHVVSLGNYAFFLYSIRGDIARAEKYFRRAMEVNPDHPGNLAKFAHFLCIRGKYDEADQLFARALQIEPGNAEIQAGYALFLENFHKNFDAAERHFARSVELNPSRPDLLTQYARFLWTVRKNHDLAELYYSKAIKLEPNNSNTTGSYALFLFRIRRDFDAAEALFITSIETTHENSGNLGNYAVFLWVSRQAFAAAESFFRRALAADASNVNAHANYSQLLFLQRRREEGVQSLQSALSLKPESTEVLCELNFYAYAHAEPQYPDALPKLKELLLSGGNSEGWDLGQNVAVAVADGHPEPEFLAALAEVVSGRKPVSTLEDFAAWKAVEVPTVPASATPA